MNQTNVVEVSQDAIRNAVIVISNACEKSGIGIDVALCAMQILLDKAKKHDVAEVIIVDNEADKH